jgi:hypothetical protein
MKGTLATEADLMKERREIRIKFSFISWDDSVSGVSPAPAQVASRPNFQFPHNPFQIPDSAPLESLKTPVGSDQQFIG